MLFCYVLERLRFPAFVAAQFIPQAFRKEKPPGEIFFCQELPGGFFQRRLFPAVGVQGFPEWHKPQAAPFPVRVMLKLCQDSPQRACHVAQDIRVRVPTQAEADLQFLPDQDTLFLFLPVQ